jgi:hypothetical protein
MSRETGPAAGGEMAKASGGWLACYDQAKLTPRCVLTIALLVRAELKPANDRS